MNPINIQLDVNLLISNFDQVMQQANIKENVKKDLWDCFWDALQSNVPENFLKVKNCSWFGKNDVLTNQIAEKVAGLLNIQLAYEQNPIREKRKTENINNSNEVKDVKKIKENQNQKIDDTIEITLPRSFDDLPEALGVFHRAIEKQYLSLDWPKEINKFCVHTEVIGGLGDIMAAAKLISVIQELCPHAQIKWVVPTDKSATGLLATPERFLQSIKGVTIEKPSLYDTTRSTDSSAQFVVIGPTGQQKHHEIGEKIFSYTTKGPIFYFAENGYNGPSFFTHQILNNPVNDYSELHKLLFPSSVSIKKGSFHGMLSMGLKPGTGVFLDPTRMNAKLSRDYCCPTYLSKIQDNELRRAIFKAMKTDENSMPNYDSYSFNSGYAVLADSLEKFIECVAIDESEKNAVIVLNSKQSLQEFAQSVMSLETQRYIMSKGFSEIVISDGKNPPLVVQNRDAKKNRQFTVIIRGSFLPEDMKNIQLASERILATGDNTAVEAMCSKCKMYVYESLLHKAEFLKQQVELANKSSPNLGTFIRTFGNGTSKENRQEFEKLLKDPGLHAATLKLCENVVEHFSFKEILAGALKRTVWHHIMPPCHQAEIALINREENRQFRQILLECFNGRYESQAGKKLVLQGLSQIGRTLK